MCQQTDRLIVYVNFRRKIYGPAGWTSKRRTMESQFSSRNENGSSGGPIIGVSPTTLSLDDANANANANANGNASTNGNANGDASTNANANAKRRKPSVKFMMKFEKSRKKVLIEDLRVRKKIPSPSKETPTSYGSAIGIRSRC